MRIRVKAKGIMGVAEFQKCTESCADVHRFLCTFNKAYETDHTEIQDKNKKNRFLHRFIFPNIMEIQPVEIF